MTFIRLAFISSWFSPQSFIFQSTTKYIPESFIFYYKSQLAACKSMKAAFYYLLSYVVERPACTITCGTALVQQGSRAAPNEELGGLWVLWVLSHACPWQPQEVSNTQGAHFLIWNFPIMCSKLLFSLCLEWARGSLRGGVWSPTSSSPTFSCCWLETAMGLITRRKGGSRDGVSNLI